MTAAAAGAAATVAAAANSCFATVKQSAADFLCFLLLGVRCDLSELVLKEGSFQHANPKP